MVSGVVGLDLVAGFAGEDWVLVDCEVPHGLKTVFAASLLEEVLEGLNGWVWCLLEGATSDFVSIGDTIRGLFRSL